MYGDKDVIVAEELGEHHAYIYITLPIHPTNPAATLLSQKAFRVETTPQGEVRTEFAC
jgi:hypothetical protein